MFASGPRSGIRSLVRCARRFPARALVILLAVSVTACGDTLYEPEQEPPGQEPPPQEPPPPSAPAVTVEVQALPRMELTDSVVLRLRAWDPDTANAITSLGFTAVVRNGGERALTGQANFEVAATDTVEASFTIRPEWLTLDDLPADLLVEFYGIAVNEAGLCAAVSQGSTQAVECAARQVAGDSVLVASVRAQDVPVTVVRGRTTLFPLLTAPVVGDLVVDTLRQQAFLSDRLSSRLHVFQPTTFSWGGTVSVGAQPWGLHLNGPGDTLLVANSGGTSVSKVALAGTPVEVVGQRIQTLNTPLFEIKLRVVEDTLPDETIVADTLTEAAFFFDFSDRPQYLAQDAAGRILYSTRPTAAAPTGTVRIVTREPGWAAHETRILARIPQDTEFEVLQVVVMNADSIDYFRNGFLEVFDHLPGHPDILIRSGAQRPLDALRSIVVDEGSDIDFMLNGKWNLESVSFADTTYVAISRNRDWVAFGDGGQPDVGRVVLWNAPTAAISRRLVVSDLVNNASERVRALELNRDGSLGMARGAFGSYFFSRDLRLRGVVPEGPPGGGGAALHPDHPDTPGPLASSPITVAFTMSGDRELRILDTVHYLERGRIELRDVITGPLRVTPPLPSDNGGQGRSCAGPSCVVAKVFAVTEAGGVVVIDVRASDIGSLP